MKLDPVHVTTVGCEQVISVLFYRSTLSAGQITDRGWKWEEQSEWLFGTTVLKEGIVPDPLVSLSILAV